MANDKRSRTNGLTSPLGTALGASDTTLSAAMLAGLPVIDATNHAAVTLLNGGTFEVVYVTSHTAGATTATILRAQEGTTAQAFTTAGTTVSHSPTVRDQAVGRFATITTTSGNVGTTGTGYALVANGLTLVVKAQVGDIIECAISAISDLGTGDLVLDMVTQNASNVITSYASGGSGTTNGVNAWRSFAASQSCGGSVYTPPMTAADIVNGAVSYTLVQRVNSGSRGLLATANDRMHLRVVNHGPQES